MLLPALLQAQLRGQSSFLEENQKIPPSHFPKSKIMGTQLPELHSHTPVLGEQDWLSSLGSSELIHLPALCFPKASVLRCCPQPQSSTAPLQSPGVRTSLSSCIRPSSSSSCCLLLRRDSSCAQGRRQGSVRARTLLTLSSTSAAELRPETQDHSKIHKECCQICFYYPSHRHSLPPKALSKPRARTFTANTSTRNA